MEKAFKIDPITVEVLRNAFMSIAEEMGVGLMRTSYSANIKERRDCSCAVFDADGNTIGQAEHIPVHLGSMLGIVSNVRKKYELSDIKPGDMFIANDPYQGGGTHLPDITLCAPVFYENKLVAFVANIAHHSDIGGRSPGSISGDSTSIFQEGLRIPPVKIMRESVMVQEIMDMILLNCRTGFERTGDLMAQISANIIGVRRMGEVFDRYGYDTTLNGMIELMDYGERKARTAIAAMPDGVYTFTDYMDDDGIDLEKKLPITVKITIEGDHIALDFTGSAPQVKGAINVVENALKASVFYALKAIIDPELPPNGGFYRAISIYAPKGCILNPIPPAAVGGRTDTCQRVADVIFGALAPVVPTRIMAGCNSAVTVPVISGPNKKNGQYFVNPESLGGGFGARYNKDGLDGVHVHITNSSNLPAECLEQEYPLMIERYELRKDSGGAGKYRGGLGYIKNYKTLQEDSVFGSHGDRQKCPPWGLFGGMPGMPGRFVINPGQPDERVLPSGKNSNIDLKLGDILSAQTPGSGGYGNPHERPVEFVLKDVINEKVSPEKARSDYGVAIDPVTFEVDYAETEKLRAK